MHFFQVENLLTKVVGFWAMMYHNRYVQPQKSIANTPQHANIPNRHVTVNVKYEHSPSSSHKSDDLRK